MANHSGIRDSGEFFQIIPTTRKIVVPASGRIIGAVGDHNSEQITFKCPKEIDGHDVANCTNHWVEWVNAKKEKGRYSITDITSDEEYIYLTWIVSKELTKKRGNVSFSVLFEDIENAQIVYSWSTNECNECTIVPTAKSNLEDNGGSETPDGYVKPYLVANIGVNGTYDAREWERAVINVKQTEAVEPKLENKTITENDVYRAEDEGLDGYKTVTVDVQPNLQQKTGSNAFKGNGTYTPDKGYDGFSKVEVNVVNAPKLQQKTVYVKSETTTNAAAQAKVETITPDSGQDGLDSVKVVTNPIYLENPDPVTPTKSKQTVTPSNGKDGLASVVVNPIPSEYVIPNGERTVTYGGNIEEDINDVTNLKTLKINVRVPSDIKPEEVAEIDGLKFAVNGTVYQLTASSGKVFSAVKVYRDENLKPENIVKGVTIYGITGTFEGYVGEAQMYLGYSAKGTIDESIIKTFTAYETGSMFIPSFALSSTEKTYFYICVPSEKEMKSFKLGTSEKLGTEITLIQTVYVNGIEYRVYRTNTLQRTGTTYTEITITF